MTLKDNPNVTEENKIGLKITMLSPSEIREYDKVGRNEPCICGSGKKFKKCHLSLYQELTRNRR